MFQRIVRKRKFSKFRTTSKDSRLELGQMVVAEDESVEFAGPVGKVVGGYFSDL
jgi:hypothetical protein